MKLTATTKIQLLTSLLLTLLFFTNCSSDDSSTPKPDSGETDTNTLTANAGPDQTITVNNEVILDGANSSDSNNEPFNYLWIVTMQPDGSNAILSNENTDSPTFTPNTIGVYVIELETSNENFESTDSVTITVTSATSSETIELGGSINENITLTNLIDTPGIADYCITGDIDLDAVMNIEPGVELHFEADLSFIVGNDGVLIAKGTADNPITFTAKDASLPWRGVGFVSSDDFRNEMDYVNISYAGVDDLSIIDRRAAIGISSFSSLIFTNSTINNSAEIGMFIEDNVELTFANNRFENNAKAPLVLPADLVGELDTVSQFNLNNGESMIEITDRFIELEEPAFWKKIEDGTSYFVSESIEVESELNIMPGVEMFFNPDTFFRVDTAGVLIANGTEELPILFTAIDNTQAWQGIGVYSDSTRNVINYAEISYAGSDNILNLDEKVAIGIGSFQALKLTNSLITNSVNNGMLIEDSAELLGFSNNRFENNAETPLIITASQLHNLDTASQFGTTNGNSYIEVLGDFLDSSDEVTWNALDDGTPYYLSGNLNFQSAFGGLNITPNVKIMVGSDLYIRVNGAFLSAKGGSEEGRIVFTAFDTSLPWQGISFLTDNVRNELDFVEVSYAGSDLLGNINAVSNIGVGAFDQLILTNSIISNGLGYGISLDDSSEINTDLEESNTLTNNILGTIFREE